MEELVPEFVELPEEDSVVVPQAVKDKIENASIADKIRFFIMLLKFYKIILNILFYHEFRFFSSYFAKISSFVKTQL